MENKNAYQQKMDAKLREWQAKIDGLKAKAEQAEADKRIEYEEEIESLRQKKQHVLEKLDELKAAGDEAWDDVKTGVEKAWVDLKSAFDKALLRFK